MVGGERVGEFPVAEGGEVLCGGEGGGLTPEVGWEAQVCRVFFVVVSFPVW